MRHTLACLAILVCSLADSGQAESLEYYLPSGQDYSPEIPRPDQFLDFEIGERHITHHELVAYAKAVAEASPRIRLEMFGRTHGHRPLIMLTVTDPGRFESLAQIRKSHQSLARPEQRQPDLETLPAVLNMGYSVHGDESSGSNAVPLVLYHLAASRSEEVAELLRNVVVLIDPCLNPDGFNRFAEWANSHRGRALNADPQHREHVQEWPGGRVNYYWFDLNRDWLPAQHPESRGRLRMYHAWKPDVVLDFHEMGTESTYFFQPGIPERKNPRIPEQNVELTARMAQFHVEALDRLGSLYFTEERFDDFYPGKGSSYPDLHGGVGILFEQGSSRGHVQESSRGTLKFGFTIRNQVATSLSSLAATAHLRLQLLEYKQQFYRESIAAARSGEIRALAFSAPDDGPRLHEFASILRRHDLRCSWLNRDTVVDGHSLEGGETIIVPTDQAEYRFLQSLLDRETDFRENIFYDVSTWALDLAFDLNQFRLKTPVPRDLLSQDPLNTEPVAVEDSDYGCLIHWESSAAPRLVGRLLRSGVLMQVATRPFQATGIDGQIKCERGTMFIPFGIQRDRFERINAALSGPAAKGVRVSRVRTGLTPEGIDLGSPSFVPLDPPRVMMLIDGPVSRYAAGEIWHLFDTHWNLPLTMVSTDELRSVDLTRYNVIICPSGRYRMNDSGKNRLAAWVGNGGTLVVQGRAIESLRDDSLFEVDLADSIGAEEHDFDAAMQEHAHAPARPYGEAETHRALQLISGAIFETRIDRTHPLGYGFTDDVLPVFRNHRVILGPGASVYSDPVRHSQDSLMAGYCSVGNRQLLNQSVSVQVVAKDRGVCVLLAENPNFRAFWFGSRRLFANAVFLGQIIKVP